MPNPKLDIVEKVETFKDLFNNAHDLIHIVEPDGAIIYVNNAWTKVLGYSQHESDGKSIYSVVYPSDRDHYLNYRESIIKGEAKSKEIAIRMLTKSGNVIYTEGSISSKVIDNVTLYTRGIFRDITARMQHEAQLKSVIEKLKEREVNLEQLFIHAPDAIVVIDAQSLIRYWNPKAEKIFGWTLHEVSGKLLTEVMIPPQYREAHNAGMKRYLATGEQRVLNKTIEITAIKKDNSEFFVGLTISPTIQNGEPAFVAFIRDIDQHKKNEKDIELQKIQLEQKGQQLEASNTQLEQFAHVASHDMKEPIRKILTFLDMLKSDESNTLSLNSKKYIQKIQSAGDRLINMVDGVLIYSTLKSEDLVTERIDLMGVLKDIESDLELLFQRYNATLKYTDLPSINGGLFLIYQLFYNLINNSLKFSRPDVPLLIQITAKQLSKEEIRDLGLEDNFRFVRVIVSDNGIGFKQEYAEAIFQSFTRLHPKDEFEGTGLGLALCKMIVERHKGHIEAFGNENEGARFHIVLPESSPAKFVS